LNEIDVYDYSVNLGQQIEAVLFVAGEGLSCAYLADKLGVTEGDVKKAVQELEVKYSGDSGVHIIKYRNNYQFSTNPIVVDAVSAVLNPVRERNLTRAALETMAIVAYKQPVTRLEIDDIRGVSSDYSIHVLLDNGLIEPIGKKDAIGRPTLYGTTDEFLKRFELGDIKNLPSYDELLEKLQQVATNFDLYERAN